MELDGTAWQTLMVLKSFNKLLIKEGKKTELKNVCKNVKVSSNIL